MNFRSDLHLDGRTIVMYKTYSSFSKLFQIGINKKLFSRKFVLPSLQYHVDASSAFSVWLESETAFWIELERRKSIDDYG